MKMNYDNYWTNKTKKREYNDYYGRRYDKVWEFLLPSSFNILDMGGGNGQFLEYINNLFCGADLRETATIMDISMDGLEIARKKGFFAVRKDIQKPIKTHKKFKLIYLAETLEHLHNPNIALVNAYNMLDNGGRLIVLQPNAKADGKHHIRQYTYNEIRNDIIKSGFIIEKELVTPAFEYWTINKKDLLSFNPKLWLCFLLTLLPYGLRKELAENHPSKFALFYMFKARKRIIK